MIKFIHFIQDGVLHLVFENSNNMNQCLSEISKRIENNDEKYEGHNFPFSELVNCKNSLFSQLSEKERRKIKYVIGYVKNDEVTKKHELLHAKYYFDKEYRKEILKLWNSLSDKKKKEITNSLNNMGYPQSFHLDEFQAYLYSEPQRKGKNFWNC